MFAKLQAQYESGGARKFSQRGGGGAVNKFLCNF